MCCRGLYDTGNNGGQGYEEIDRENIATSNPLEAETVPWERRSGHVWGPKSSRELRNMLPPGPKEAQQVQITAATSKSARGAIFACCAAL